MSENLLSSSSTKSQYFAKGLDEVHNLPSTSTQKAGERGKEKSNEEDSNKRKHVFHKTDCLLVNRNQAKNPLLKHIRQVAWEFADIDPAHYVMSPSCCALFLSLKYHVLNPDYIYNRLTALGNSYRMKVLLVLIDHIEYNASLKELTKLAIRASCTLMLAWSPEEAAYYLDTYKSFEEKSPEIIMGKQSGANAGGGDVCYQAMIEALSSIKSISKTDAMSLISLFESFDKIVKADDDELGICPGLGQQKADRLKDFFQRPFIRQT